uniref:Kelch like family member 7 n=1 Tax=Stegastes partitus TaxID=144197 RepID=A0A3B4ZHZ5_9TELE
MAEVLGCVRFPLVSKTFLSKTVRTEPLIQDNPECLKMVLSAMCYRPLSLKDRRDLGESSRPRRKKHDYRIALFGGSQLQSCRYFNPKVPGCTYIFATGAITAISFTETPFNCGTMCLSTGSSALDFFECYDIRTASWQIKTSMLMARFSHGSVEANGLIYVCGGVAGNNFSGRVLNNCEVYDPKTHQWRELCGMREARKNHGLVVVNNRIYAVGGQGALGGLVSVEYYSIADNEWCAASPMPWRGVAVKCAAVGNVIYVLAGRGELGERMPEILEYHIGTDRWVATCKNVPGSLPSNCLICVVNI